MTTGIIALCLSVFHIAHKLCLRTEEKQKEEKDDEIKIQQITNIEVLPYPCSKLAQMLSVMILIQGVWNHRSAQDHLDIHNFILRPNQIISLKMGML